MPVPTYTSSGSKSSTAAKLSKDVFDVKPKNDELLKQAYVTYLANGRENLAKTLKRGEVRGGGRKPWRQKGTGRARFGSIRVPIWRGGGITFGPLGKENYSKKMNKAAKQTAIRQALSVKSANNAIIVMDEFAVKDAKTNTAAKLLSKVEATGRILIVLENITPEIQRATSNLLKTDVAQAQYLNVYTVLNADTIIITKKALAVIDDWLSAKKEAKQ